MKLLQNSKFTGPALLLLLLLNTSLLIMLLMKHPGAESEFPPFPQGGPRDFIVHELKMDEPQQKKYDTLIKFHRASMERIQKDIRLHRDSMVTQLGNPVYDTTHIKSLADKIGNDQSQIEKVTFDHFREVRSLCTPEQQQKFDSIIREALRMMGPPQGPPPHDRMHGPPPPPRN